MSKYLAVMKSYGEKPICELPTTDSAEVELARLTGNIDIGIAIAAWFEFATVGERMSLTTLELEVREK